MGKARHKRSGGMGTFSHSGELVVALQNTDKAVRRIGGDSSALAEAWLMLGEETNRGRREQLRRFLVQLYAGMSDTAMEKFFADIVGTQDGLLGRFLTELCAEGIMAIGLSIHRTGDQDLGGRLATRLFGSGNPNFTRVLEVAQRQHGSVGKGRAKVGSDDNELDALYYLLGCSMLAHRVPIPRTKKSAYADFLVVGIW